MVKAFLFDIGNVILRFDFGQAAERIAPRCSVPAGEILPSTEDMKQALEAGEMSSDDFVLEATKRIGFSGTGNEFISAFVDIFTENEPMSATIRALSESGYGLYLLSNTNGLHAGFFMEKYPVFEAFHGAIFSHEAKSMKPEPEIYQAAIEEYGLQADATVYVDDLPANVEAGVRQGLLGLTYDYDDHGGFLAELKKLGVEV